jgi:hypothetical protein
VGSLNCGNGVPAWFSAAAAGPLVGQPLVTALPYSAVPGLDVAQLPGYDACGANATAWAAHAGDANYNLLSPCCQAMNSGNPGALGFSTLAQATMDYLVEPGPGRAAFVRFWALLADAVRSHPSAVAAEFMNEPMTIRRTLAFDTWREAGTAVAAVVPDMAVSVCDTGEAILLPPWVVNATGGHAGISNETLAWIKTAGNVYLAWHWYALPANASDAVQDALALGDEWGVPTLLTEFMDCTAWQAAAAAGIGHLYWHYSAYCNTGAAFAGTPTHDTFGACILGWAGGDSNYTCK